MNLFPLLRIWWPWPVRTGIQIFFSKYIASNFYFLKKNYHDFKNNKYHGLTNDVVEKCKYKLFCFKQCC